MNEFFLRENASEKRLILYLINIMFLGVFVFGFVVEIIVIIVVVFVAAFARVVNNFGLVRNFFAFVHPEEVKANSWSDYTRFQQFEVDFFNISVRKKSYLSNDMGLLAFITGSKLTV